MLSLVLAFVLADVTGTWIVERTMPNGQRRETVYKLKQDGNLLTGSVLQGLDELPLKGTIEGDALRFETTSERDFVPRVQKYAGEVKDASIEIRMERGAGGPGGPGGPPPGMGPGGPRPGPPGPQVARRLTPEELKSREAAAKPHPKMPALKAVPYNGLAKTPAMGWNSWNKFRTRFDDKTVREIADAMITSGMKDAGYLYINIDDGWQGKRDTNGVLQANANFPDMKALSDYVHSKGLKLGIYSSPGPRTCAQFEGSYQHEEIDARTWAAWGIDYLKYDWCSATEVYKSTDMRPVYQIMGEALRATGRPILYSLCQYGREKVWEWGPLVGGNSWRTTGDISDRWASMDDIGFRHTPLAAFAKPGHWNDPDMLEIGNGGMTTTEYRTHMSLWSLLSSPLLAGNDIRTMTDETRSILLNKEVIAIDQDKLGKVATKVSQDGKTEVWARPVEGGWAIALFNRGDAVAKVTARFTDFNGKKKLALRDLWTHQDLGAFTQSYTADVPPHGVVMVRAK